MLTSRDYSIKRRGCYYNLSTRSRSSTKEENCVYFSSLGELECFLELEASLDSKYNIHFQPQYNYGGLKWRLDFKLSPKNNGGFLTLGLAANYFNSCSFNQAPHLLLEYKGFLDSNFRSKLRKMAEVDINSFNLLVVLGNQDDIYSFYLKGTKYTKSIYKPNQVGYIIKKLSSR